MFSSLYNTVIMSEGGYSTSDVVFEFRQIKFHGQAAVCTE